MEERRSYLQWLVADVHESRAVARFISERHLAAAIAEGRQRAESVRRLEGSLSLMGRDQA